jgi:lysophospholipase L1-like esterase
VWWIKINVFVWNYWYATAASSSAYTPAPRGSRPTRKLVHIGDEVALGVGDWINFFVPAGLLHYINLQQPLLLSKWVSANEGKVGATSEDWIPGGYLFESYFNTELLTKPRSSHHLDADIVMITVGTNDTCSAAQSASNVMLCYRELKERLSNKNAVVIINVPPIPNVVLARGDDSKVKQRVVARNEALRAALLKHDFDERANKSAGAEEDVAPLKHVSQLARVAQGSLRFGVDLHEMFCQQLDHDPFCLRGLYLKPRAYKEAVRQGLGQTVLLAQRTVEADDLRRLVSGGGRR